VGYRHYLYKIKKKDVNKIKKLSLKELADKYEEESDYIDFFKIIEKAQPVFEFGKLYWEDTAERIYATGKPLFDNKKVQDNFDDFCPYIVGKKALMVAINIYKDKIKTMYNTLLQQDEEKTIEDKYDALEKHIKDYQFWWDKCNILDLEDDSNKICQSWLYEHLIFELVHQLKIINFEEYDLIFMWW